MRELRALGLTDDGNSLVLVDLSRGAEGERFRVAADERLRAALRSGASRPAATTTETRVESALSPREIQARLRSGATADQVAKSAGIPVGRIQRYEAPILAERSRVVSEARAASAPGPHRNTPGKKLGALVDERLVEEGHEPDLVEWDATRRTDGTWTVTLRMDPGLDPRATWSWDPAARRVRAADAGATAMLAPVPAPSAGPDSLTAIAEATGVAEAAEAATERRAVGDDRRITARGAAGRPSGLVVLPGRDSDTASLPAASTASPSTATMAGAGIATDVPGGSEPVPARSARTEARPTSAFDTLLPGTEPAAGPGAYPARQQRLGEERAPEVELPVTPDEPEAAGGESAPARQAARAGSGRRRSAVPAWDDIMFGARRG